MNYIFFAFGILALIWEFMSMGNPVKTGRFANKLKIDIKEKGWGKLSDTQKQASVFIFLYLFWSFFGLFTQQWFLFLILILISLIPKKWNWYRVIDSVITIVIIIFALINEFHLHIDLWNFIQLNLLK